MAQITLIYPDSWLSPTISVKNRDTWSEDFTWAMTEVGTTAAYIFDFTEAESTDYIYTATVTDFDDLSGVIYSSTWWATPEEIDAELTAKHGEWPWNQRVNWIGWLKSNEMEELLDRFKKDILKAKTEPIKEEKETLESKLARSRSEKTQEKITNQLKQLQDKLESIENNLDNDYTLDYIEDKFNEVLATKEIDAIQKDDVDNILEEVLADAKLDDLLNEAFLDKLLKSANKKL